MLVKHHSLSEVFSIKIQIKRLDNGIPIFIYRVITYLKSQREDNKIFCNFSLKSRVPLLTNSIDFNVLEAVSLSSPKTLIISQINWLSTTKHFAIVFYFSVSKHLRNSVGEMAFNFVVLAILFIASLAYYYVKRQFDYWKVRGVPHLKPDFPFGSLKGVGKTTSMSEIWERQYNALKGKGPIAGVFFFTAPSAMILDLDLLRNIFVKDFQHFHDRGMYVNEKDDPLSAHLFNLEGAKWKNLRSKLSPTFTSGKMKMMLPTMLTVVEQFRDHLAELTNGKAKEVELKELLAQFTTDVIGSTAFGVECNSMKNPDSEFRRNGKKVFENTPMRMIKMIFMLNFQDLSRAMGLKFSVAGVTEFFMKLLNDTVKYREENNVKRSDFLQLLMQIKNTGKLEGEETELGKMTFNELAAQVFLFFIAGFETSSSTMTFAFYELAMNPDVQEKARAEVDDVLNRYGGEWSYDAVMELTYIDQIIHGLLIRKCLEEI